MAHSRVFKGDVKHTHMLAMTEFKLGSRLRTLRLSKGLSQASVCQGICDRTLLSKIENEEVSPSLDTLRHICSRLGASIHDVVTELDRDEDGERILQYVRQLVMERQFHEVIRFVRRSLILNCSLVPRYRGELLRFLGIGYHGLGEFDEAVGHFRAAYENHPSDLGLSSKMVYLNSYAAGLLNTGRANEAFDLLSTATELSRYVPLDPRTQIRLLCNSALAARRLHLKRVVHQNTDEGLTLCTMNHLVECSGNMLTVSGLNWLDEDRPDKARALFERARLIYEFQGDSTGTIGSLLNIADCFIVEGDKHRASQVLKQARQLEKDGPR